MKLKILWQRPEMRFLIFFMLILAVSFTVVALQTVNDRFVVPYTTLVARMSGTILDWIGEEITINGVILSSPRFTVTIYNGCNGLITSLIFISGVLAFPSRWGAKIIGVVGGLLAIQVINLIRIISLFYIGIYVPSMFNQSHIFIWQSIVILAGVSLWVFWAHRFAAPNARDTGEQ